MLEESGHTTISVSSEISAEMKYLDRTETTVVNAYLLPLMNTYLSGIRESLNNDYHVMTSAGTLANSAHFTPKDSLLSGPAGGIKGAVATAELVDFHKIISFDMGGTSTDVGLYDHGYDYTYITEVGGARIQAPALNIHTIAAGGGSVCGYSDNILFVGPESAGAHPGPACYGADGPLTLSDINLLSGRLDTSEFPIPLSSEASEQALEPILKETGLSRDEVMASFHQIAHEKMAEAIRKISVNRGSNLNNSAIVAFGGACGKHVCDLAELLEINKVIVPYEAGLLSANGIATAEIGTFANCEIYKLWNDSEEIVKREFTKLRSTCEDQLESQGLVKDRCYIAGKWVFLRFYGQETSLEVPYTHHVLGDFRKLYEKTYGHWIETRPIEVTSIRIHVSCASKKAHVASASYPIYFPEPSGTQESLFRNVWVNTALHKWEHLSPGARISGPAIISSDNSTIFLHPEWTATLNQHNIFLLDAPQLSAKNADSNLEAANLRLYMNRFRAIVEEMGAVLERSSFSVNVKERLDFSCALMDAQGSLVVNAPHIPVHLGSLGMCVRKACEATKPQQGDVIITNHPAMGGSHLPDITLITPVFFEDSLIAYVANRAHHAEIGGKTPGSMPPDATSLEEEGAIIYPQFLVKDSKIAEGIDELFSKGPYPSRAIEENLADLQAGIASLHSGVAHLQRLCKIHGVDNVTNHMQRLQDYVFNRFEEVRQHLSSTSPVSEYLDDGSKLQVSITNTSTKMLFDFTGTSARHHGNLNATPAIVRSVVLYVLRLLVDDDIPLNEGMLKNVQVILPDDSLLNPDFSKYSPAVVGGNTEVSQRLCDTLLKSFGMSACSQGTMNNLIFGNDKFGFYETIGGGTGAGNGYHGQHAVHQHMTNTRITDPEILEFKYPVRLLEFSRRHGSGGKGKWYGGDGIVRRIEFLEPVELSILSQHRKEAPYGLKGGLDGKTGTQTVIRTNGEHVTLEGSAYIKCESGDQVEIRTPGGGGYGHT